MDDGSRLVAELAAGAAPVVEGRALRVWDCCAAPGGKTTVLARRLVGAELLATDVSARRMEAMKRRLARYGVAPGGVSRVRFGVAGATVLPEVEGSFDLILCDVPCSGTGTLARNPEIRHRLRVEELGRQAERQGEILRAAIGRLAAGGRLVYSTCSLEPEEGERVVAAVLAEVAGVRPVEVGDVLRELVASGVLRADVGSVVRDRALRTFPGIQDCDGFYAVVLERFE